MQTVTASILRANPSVVSAELDGEAVLLNTDTGIYFGLDLVGTEIWRLIEKGASEEAIYAELLSQFDVAPERLRADVSTFLSTLEAKGLAQARLEG